MMLNKYGPQIVTAKLHCIKQVIERQNTTHKTTEKDLKASKVDTVDPNSTTDMEAPALAHNGQPRISKVQRRIVMHNSH